MTYYYKVTVTDLSGNSSVFSDSVNASVAVDAEKPVIHSVYPSVDTMIGVGLKTVSVPVSDNNELSFILIINNASDEFSMLDNVITLNVPDGLTLMDTNVSSGSSVVKISEIKGQTTETIRSNT